MLIVYFSSATENTRRFVDKLDLPNVRIPLHKRDEPLIVNEPYCLILPTYGGGASLNHQNSRPVPVQVIRFLNNEHNRSFIRCVAAGGNTNFGSDYGRAGEIISQKCKVPYVYRFELMGTKDDVTILRNGLLDNAEQLGFAPREDVASGV
ncbi:MAG: class Ib ribonucleoside-diphosphate reductase assembly flavoprotein NrdI [Corynebacterium sp.]|nr:class Ib ribonucleoside-diphosphate reductase assembly flavoprotein NrdI [Corynebacterium sp.]